MEKFMVNKTLLLQVNLTESHFCTSEFAQKGKRTYEKLKPTSSKTPDGWRICTNLLWEVP